MADANIKKVIVSPQSLAAVNIVGDNPKYFVRYRIVSEDKSRISAWSPIFELDARPVPDILNNVTQTPGVIINNNLITITWTTPDELKTAKYDVYVSWNNHPASLTKNYSYVGSVQATKNNSFSLPKLDGYNRMYVRIQVSTSPKVISDSALVAETATAITI